MKTLDSLRDLKHVNPVDDHLQKRSEYLDYLDKPKSKRKQAQIEEQT
jgi:hypothetical protein